MLALRAFCASLLCATALAACSSSNPNGASKPPAPVADQSSGPGNPSSGGNGAPANGGAGSSGGGGGLAAGAGGSADGGAPAQQLSHRRCGWMNDDIALGKASFAANADFFDTIHPYWFTLNADGTLTATSWADDAAVIATAHAHKVALMPLVYGGDVAASIRNVISSPAAITAHVNLLVQLAVSRQYDGLEMDYEHLWQASDRAGYTALMVALAQALHAQGKTLSLAVPAIPVDNLQNGYDYAALAAGGVDVVHLMGYDFHSISSDHLGPLAPLGWIDAVAARVQQLGIAKSFVLGIANYGVGSGWYANSGDLITQCGPNYATTTDHMLTCPYGTYTAGISPHCTTARGDVWFEDLASMTEKANSAAAHGLRGISYYTLGGEPAGFFDAMRAVYP